MGFFSGLGDEAYDRQYSDRELIKRIIKYFKPQRERFSWVSFYLVTIAITGAATLVIVSRGVDVLAEQPESKVIIWLVGAVFVVGIYSWCANWLRRRLLTRIVGDVILKLRSDAFQATSKHDLSFYDEFASGRIVSRITTDTRDFGQLIIIVTDLISQIMEALILVGVLISIEWRLSLWISLFLPIL